MRQIWITVPAGEGDSVLELAKEHNGTHLVMLRAQGEEQELDMVVVNVSNKEVGKMFQVLKTRNLSGILLYPNEVFPFSGKHLEVADQVTRVTQRSPVEVWVNGLQSIGSWIGFLGYALAASIVVWIGMFTNTPYMLVGAMLIAPFAGPAMNFALGTATGSKKLLKRNLLRYSASLALTILVSAGLSLIFQQNAPTNTMIGVSEISSLAVLLPLVAGAVGAHSLSQPKNNSFVPGAAVGILIAVSLAPPAGLTGMSAAIGRWDMALNGLFLLLMQLFAINLTGALVFRYYNQSPRENPERSMNLYWASLGFTTLLLAGMLVLQFRSFPNFQRSSGAQRANEVVQQVVRGSPHASMLEASVRYPRPSVQGQNKLLATIFVERDPQSALSTEQIKEDLSRQIYQELHEKGYMESYISVTVIDPP